jgi:hypothetical protein
MKARRIIKLRTELAATGADKSEIDELIQIADHLEQTRPDKNTSSYLKLKPLTLVSTWTAAIAAGAFLIIVSQTVLPNNLLYPLQKVSDRVAIDINPGFQGTVMMKQAQQVKELVSKHANSGIVLATLADYQNSAKAYGTHKTNYAVFEYCKNNLRQAAAMAPNTERPAIDHTLYSLKDV